MFDVGCSMFILTITQSPSSPIQIFLANFHFSPESPVEIFRGKRKSQTQRSRLYTLRAGKEKNQINQAQFRSKSGALVSEKMEEREGENSRTGQSGKDQEIIAGASSEIWF